MGTMAVSTAVARIRSAGHDIAADYTDDRCLEFLNTAIQQVASLLIAASWPTLVKEITVHNGDSLPENYTKAAGRYPLRMTDGVTDEFVKPIVRTGQDGQPLATVREGDVVICYNFRTDRGREITQALTQRAFPEYGMEPLALRYITMTSYDETFSNVGVVFHKDNLYNTLGQVLESNGRTQTRIAETEK